MPTTQGKVRAATKNLNFQTEGHVTETVVRIGLGHPALEDDGPGRMPQTNRAQVHAAALQPSGRRLAGVASKRVHNVASCQPRWGCARGPCQNGDGRARSAKHNRGLQNHKTTLVVRLEQRLRTSRPCASNRPNQSKHNSNNVNATREPATSLQILIEHAHGVRSESTR